MTKVRDAVLWSAIGGAAMFFLTGGHSAALDGAQRALAASALSAVRGSPGCPGDINADGTVNTADLVILLGNFGAVCSTDADGDGVSDASDNCPFTCNPNQADTDGDGRGDRCDNCLLTPNPSQTDANFNGIGDDCEGLANDDDGDGIDDSIDNCAAFNPDQLDSDFDGLGDACDNCPFHPNPGQQDADLDGRGDACDTTSDNDGDGVSTEAGDCNDFDSNRYPGAPDPCGDGIDQNCDGVDG